MALQISDAKAYRATSVCSGSCVDRYSAIGNRFRHQTTTGIQGQDNYKAKDWHLQIQGGLDHSLTVHGIAYHWLSELGNPQKKDPAMAILKKHLDDPTKSWPVHRGLELLEDIFWKNKNSVCLMCACKGPHDHCHRSVIATAFAKRQQREIEIVNLS